MQYLYDQIVDTDYNVLTPSDFKCAFYRGVATNPIYYLNQFLDIPLTSGASTVNAASFVLARAHQCLSESGRRASVVYVDMFLEGDVVGAVNALNLEYAGD